MIFKFVVSPPSHNSNTKLNKNGIHPADHVIPNSSERFPSLEKAYTLVWHVSLVNLVLPNNKRCFQSRDALCLSPVPYPLLCSKARNQKPPHEANLHFKSVNSGVDTLRAPERNQSLPRHLTRNFVVCKISVLTVLLFQILRVCDRRKSLIFFCID